MNLPDQRRAPRHRRALLLLLLPLLFLLVHVTAAADPAPTQDGRVIVLGFDGGDYRTANEMMQRGEMPNLARLAGQGVFAPLGTTESAESPVAWAALNSGQNPSKTGVPGFVMRELPEGNDGSKGDPMPAIGFYENVTRKVDAENMPEAPWYVLSLAEDGGVKLAIFGGLIALVGFMVIFKLLLRLKLFVAFGLSAVLAVAGAFGALSAGEHVPREIPGIVANPIAVDSFWEVAAKQGKRAVVLEAAMCWDRTPVEGARVMAGLGLPDVRGSYGDWFVYTDDPYELEKPPKGNTKNLTGGTVFKINFRDGRADTVLVGPVDFVALDRVQRELDEQRTIQDQTERGYQATDAAAKRVKELEKQLSELRGERVTTPMVLEKTDDGALSVSIGGRRETLTPGKWSDWYEPVFELSPLIKAHAITRVKLLEQVPGEDRMELFVDVMHLDPRNPLFWQPASQPMAFSKDLAARAGRPFETVGWACITHAYKDKKIDAVTMLQDIEYTLKWREMLTRRSLESDDWDVLMTVFSTPDRVQHMTYHFYDEGHPLYDAEAASKKLKFFGEEITLAEAIPAIYRQIDRIIGMVMDEYLAPNDVLLVCADHGFQSFRYQVSLNTWLEHEGYLVMKEGVTSRMNQGLAFVDWEKTRAYALGLGMIYLNQQGREPRGIVPAAEAPALAREIRDRLLMLTDDSDGNEMQVVEEVAILADVHDGPFLDREGDLMVGFRPHYRVSWSTTTGGIELAKRGDGSYGTGDVIFPNDSHWSGSHVSVAPSSVTGMFACNRPVEVPASGVHLLHIAPTTLRLLGIDPPPGCDLEPLDLR
ncbi:MAG: alkaline phosphatase family protein [Planctomycetes bacterium]|nr:alkaline phosphatase family protein [Planctomycetota bacterium]MCB9905871.1 alkaline phosphatase family protein [Planctomycetota bacterium]